MCFQTAPLFSQVGGSLCSKCVDTGDLEHLQRHRFLFNSCRTDSDPKASMGSPAETGRLCLVPSHSSLGSPVCAVGWQWWAWDPSVKHYKHSPWHKPWPRQGHGGGLPPHCGDLPGRLTVKSWRKSVASKRFMSAGGRALPSVSQKTF